MTSIEYVSTPKDPFIVTMEVGTLVSPTSKHLFPSYVCEQSKSFRTSREAFEFVRSFTAEKASSYLREHMRYFQIILERQIILRRHMYYPDFHRMQVMMTATWHEGEFLGYACFDR